MALINQRIMRAETQYEDFIGTVAADFNADGSFVEFCRAVGVDLKRYKPVGFRFHCNYGKFDTAIHCQDLREVKPYLVELKFECEPIEEFFHLFRALQVVAYDHTYKEYAELPIEKRLCVNDLLRLE